MGEDNDDVITAVPVYPPVLTAPKFYPDIFPDLCGDGFVVVYGYNVWVGGAGVVAGPVAEGPAGVWCCGEFYGGSVGVGGLVWVFGYVAVSVGGDGQGVLSLFKISVVVLFT